MTPRPGSAPPYRVAHPLDEDERQGQHCSTFSRGLGHADLHRFEKPWEVKICKGSGLTINQSKIVDNENYIVVNYLANSVVTRIWVLWDARDGFFSERKPNTNARTINMAEAGKHVEIIDEREKARKKGAAQSDPAQDPKATEPATARRTPRGRSTGRK
jgi:hypothetical protein